MKQFPLKLVPFEELFLLKHRADYPATFFAFFEFSQPLDRELAELAFQAACQKHPLVRAKVERRAKGFWWKPTDQPVIHWSDKPVGLDALGSGNLDIEQEPGIKVWAFDGQVGRDVAACMQFLIHHVALDGLGFLQFYGDWLKFYQQLQRSAGSACRR